MPQSLHDKSLQNWPQAAYESSTVSSWEGEEDAAVGEAMMHGASILKVTAIAMRTGWANIVEAVTSFAHRRTIAFDV